MKYYKVVKKIPYNGVVRYVSARAWDGPIVVQYELKKWAKPRISGTKLFLFNNLKAATDFASVSDEIFEILATGVSSCYQVSDSLAINDIKWFWLMNKIGIKCGIKGLPYTCCADRIMLIRKVG